MVMLVMYEEMAWLPIGKAPQGRQIRSATMKYVALQPRHNEWRLPNPWHHRYLMHCIARLHSHFNRMGHKRKWRVPSHQRMLMYRYSDSVAVDPSPQALGRC
jgi:hypothetical protein